MNERCENCKFFHKLKHNFQVGKGFEESFACNVMISIPDENGKTETTGWIQEVSPSDFCELFTANWGADNGRFNQQTGCYKRPF